MTPEEFQRLKEAEKEHLLKLKELKQAVRGLQHRQTAERTLGEMTSTSQELLQESSDLVERLAFETARSEAQMEMALDASREEEAARAREQFDVELQAARARELVRQLKSEMDRPEARAQSVVNPSESDSSDEPDSLPEKTIGRIRPR
jgi:hypothetical protein